MSRDGTEDAVDDTAASKTLEPKPSEPKPSRALPTNRVAFTKQLEILRAFGAVADGTKAVSNSKVAELVDLHASTVGLITPFFIDVGLLKRTPEGMIPAPEVVAFNQAYTWSPDTAAVRLAPILSRMWFAEAIAPRLRFNPMTDDAAIQELAIAASAGPSYKGQLTTLLEYLNSAGIIVRENGSVRLSQKGASVKTEPPQEEAKPMPSPSPEPPAARHSPVSTTFTNNAAGVVQFNISVKVDMTEFAGWEPNRISAFFAGIAQVLAAKGSIERQATGQ